MRNSSSRFLTFTGVMLIALAGCDGGGSPTSPSMPQALNVTGSWSGPITISGADGGGCAGEAYLQLIGQDESLSMALTQSGSMVHGTVTITTQFSSWTNTVSGTLDGSQLGLTVVGSCTPYEFECRNGRVLTFCVDSISYQATVSGDRMQGSYVEVDGSEEVGDLTLRAVFDVTR